MGHAAVFCAALCAFVIAIVSSVVLNGGVRLPSRLEEVEEVPAAARGDSTWTVLMVDSRRLDSNLTAAAYPSLAAVANADYAARHGYRFIYAVPLELPRALLAAVNASTPAGALRCYHPLHRAARAPNWARLPILWHLLTAHGGAAARVVYVDSDLIIVGNDSMPEFLRRPHLSGPSPAAAPLAMLTNEPWGLIQACSGLVAAQAAAGAADFVRDWWDIDAPYYNNRHVFEQSALWDLIYHGNNRSRLNASVISVIDERAFLDDSHASLPVAQREHRFARHWTKHLGHNQGVVMRNALQRMGYTSASFTRKIRALQDNGNEQLYDTLPISERMARATAAEQCRVGKLCDGSPGSLGSGGLVPSLSFARSLGGASSRRDPG